MFYYVIVNVAVGDVKSADPDLREVVEEDNVEPSQEPPQGILRGVPPKETGEQQDIQEEVPSKKGGSGKGLVNHLFRHY